MYVNREAVSYFFADFGAGVVGRLDLANDNAAYMFAKTTDSPVDLLSDADGALYVPTRSRIARITAP